MSETPIPDPTLGDLLGRNVEILSKAEELVDNLTLKVHARPSAAEVAKRRPPNAEPKVEETPAQLSLLASGAKVPIEGAHAELDRVLTDGFRGASPPDGKQYIFTEPQEGLWQLSTDPAVNRRIVDEAYTSTQAARHATTPALVAADFCGPAEPRYDFLNVADGAAGVVRLPQVGAPRGKVTFTPSATVDTLRDVAGIGTEWDGSSKSTYTLNCSTNVTVELVAHYTSIKFSNELALYSPEYLAHTEATARAIHAQNVSTFLVDQIRDAADNFGAVGTGGGTVIEVVRNLTYFAGWLRARYAAPENTILDVGLPYWVRDSLEVDYASRPNTTEIGIGGPGWTQRLRRAAGVDIQWLYGLDASLSSPAPPGWATALFWFAGSVIHLTGREIDTGIYRDSILTAANEAATFRESWNAALFQGPEPVEVSIPICSSGDVGSPVESIGCEGS